MAMASVQAAAGADSSARVSQSASVSAKGATIFGISLGRSADSLIFNETGDASACLSEVDDETCIPSCGIAVAKNSEHSSADAADCFSAKELSTSSGCPYIGLSRRDSLLMPMLLWDSTMARSIAALLERSAERSVLHVCGSFHCEGRHGISEMLRNLNSKARQLVIVMYPESDCHTFQKRHTDAADFVILTDASLPRSHDYGHSL